MHDIRLGFELDPRIARDTTPLLRLGLCELRIMDDRRWPWLLLVPRRAGVTELHELTPLDQTMATFETVTVSQALKAATGCGKINVAALGNVVPQLHIHVVARSEGDPGWPGPVWGRGERQPYAREDLHRFGDAVRSSLSQ